MDSGLTRKKWLRILPLLPLLLAAYGCPARSNANQPQNPPPSYSPPTVQKDEKADSILPRKVPTHRIESPDLEEVARLALGDFLRLRPVIYDSTKLPWQELERCCQIPYGSLRGLPVIFEVVGKKGHPLGYALKVTDGGMRVAVLVVDEKLRPLRMRGNTAASRIMELAGRFLIEKVGPRGQSPTTEQLSTLGLNPFEALAAREMARQLIVGLTYLADQQNG